MKETKWGYQDFMMNVFSGGEAAAAGRQSARHSRTKYFSLSNLLSSLREIASSLVTRLKVIGGNPTSPARSCLSEIEI